jgi:multicomponent Na+:H+ antiporter subunit G
MTGWMVILWTAREIAATILCALASVFAVAGAFGALRFPDAYTRLHASSLSGTTAVFTAFVASLVLSPGLAVAARIVVIMVFFLVSNPTATHIIARYAWNSGLDPWNRAAGLKKRRDIGGDTAGNGDT